MSLNGAQMAKILRKSYENHKAQFPKLSLLLAKNQYFVILAFKMLKLEFKFKYPILITNV